MTRPTTLTDLIDDKPLLTTYLEEALEAFEAWRHELFYGADDDVELAKLEVAAQHKARMFMLGLSIERGDVEVRRSVA